MTESFADADGLYVAVDVQYLDDTAARAAMVGAPDRRFAQVTRTQTALVPVSA